MRILYITNHLEGTDGWSRYSLDLIEEVKRQGHDVKVAVSEAINDKSSIEQLVFFGDPIKYLLNPIACFRSAKRLKILIKEWQPDIIHFLVEPYANILPFLKLPEKIKVYLTLHGTFSYAPNLFDNTFKKFFARAFFLKTLSKVYKIVAISNFTKNYFLDNVKKAGIPPVSVIGNGVKMPDIKSYPKVSPPQIIFVGAVKERKGLKEAIEILRYYRDHYSKNFSYLIISKFNPEDFYYKNLQELIARYGLQSNVRFAGRVSEDDLKKYYEESSLLLLLPKIGRRFEGFGLVYLEAGARGLPVIAAQGSGASEAVNDGKSGFVVNSSNIEEAASRIDKILNAKAIRSEDCIAWADKNRIELKVGEILKLYKS